MTYDLFISYAHADNTEGWVTFLRDALVADHARYRSGEMLVPFFDTTSLSGIDDWEHHILRGLQESRLFLAVLQPTWFKSDYCRRELREYLDPRAGFALSGEGLLPVHFIEVPDQAEGWIDDQSIAEEVAWCRAKLLEKQARLESWFPAGEEVLGTDAAKVRVGEIAEWVMPSVQDRLDRTRIAEAVEGNVRATTPTFVGRHVQIRALHDAASLTTPGTVALIHGPGGFGKTELAVAYANEYRAEYGGGVWQIAAETQGRGGQTQGGEAAGDATQEASAKETPPARQATRQQRDALLLAAIGSLAPDLGLSLTDEERTDPAAAGRAVIAHLRAKVQRARAMQAERVAATKDSDRPVRMVRQAALVVLDNLDDPKILGRRQLDQISAGNWDWLRLAATTRLAPDEFAGHSAWVKPVEVCPLSDDESLMLLREHQPVRQPGGVRRFADADQEQAAREIAAELGGLTLVVEQVAVHLGLSHGYPLTFTEPSEYLRQFRAAGASSIDEHVLGDDAELDALRHEDAVMAYVMDTTLAQLPPDAAMALKVTSLLPVDAVPWPWVAEIVTRRGAGTAPDKVAQFLTGRRLLTRTADDELFRIHRIHAEHLAGEAEVFESDVVAAISEVVEGTDPGGKVQVWQLRAVLEAALPRLGSSSDLEGLGWGAFIQTAYAYLGATVLPLAEALVTARRAPHTGAPDNQTYQRDLAIGLSEWAGLVRDFDAARADGMYRESLALHRALHTGAPDNQTYQQDLAIGLDNWARLVQGFDPTRAEDMYRESIGVFRALHQDAPNNHGYQRDLAIGLGTWAQLVQNFDPARADRMYRESIGHFRALHEGAPGNQIYRQALAALLGNWARLVQGFDPTRADDMYRESIDFFRALHHGAPSNQTHLNALATGLVDWSLHRERSSRPVPTSDWAEACRLWNALAATRKLTNDDDQYRLGAWFRVQSDRPAT
jgi:hypothetical protein